MAHNNFYEQVLVPKIEILMGQMIEVEIIECTKYSMKAKIVPESLENLQKKLISKLELSKDKNNNQNNECGVSSCCSNQSQSSCCQKSNNKTNSCCSKSENNDANLLQQNLVETKYDNRNRLGDYAMATLVSLSAILISRIALKYFYEKS